MIARLLSVSLFFFFFIACNSTDNQVEIKSSPNTPFGQLSELILDSVKDIKVYYDPGLSRIINADIPENDLLYDPETKGDKRALVTKITNTRKDSQLILFSYGLKGIHPLFGIMSNDTFLNHFGSIPGTQLYIPGDSNIYAVNPEGRASKKYVRYQLQKDSLSLTQSDQH